MSEQLTLAAETRGQVGKGASRSLRREGRVPAVIYGNKQDPQAIHVEEKALMRALMTGHFMNSTVLIDIAGSLALTLPKDVSFDAVSDRPVHVGVWLDGSAGFTGTGVASRTEVVTLGEGPAEVVIGGITVRILGIDAEGGLRVEGVKVTPGRALAFSSRGRPNVIYIYH